MRTGTDRGDGLDDDAGRGGRDGVQAAALGLHVVREEAPGVHRALREHDRRRVHEHVLHGVVELRAVKTPRRAGFDALEGGCVRVAGMRGGV